MKCLAYVPVKRQRDAWKQCARRTVRVGKFCRAHEDGVTGAVLGLWVAGLPERVMEFVREEKKKTVDEIYSALEKTPLNDSGRKSIQ